MCGSASTRMRFASRGRCMTAGIGLRHALTRASGTRSSRNTTPPSGVALTTRSAPGRPCTRAAPANPVTARRCRADGRRSRGWSTRSGPARRRCSPSSSFGCQPAPLACCAGSLASGSLTHRTGRSRYRPWSTGRSRSSQGDWPRVLAPLAASLRCRSLPVSTTCSPACRSTCCRGCGVGPAATRPCCTIFMTPWTSSWVCCAACSPRASVCIRTVISIGSTTLSCAPGWRRPASPRRRSTAAYW